MIADEAYLTESMMDPLAKIHAGYPAGDAEYLGRLRPAETAAIVELIKSLRDARRGRRARRDAAPGAGPAAAAGPLPTSHRARAVTAPST